MTRDTPDGPGLPADISAPDHVWIVSGKDPLVDAGGYASYAHALASELTHIGHMPHIVSISDKHEEIQTEFARIHRVWSPAYAAGTIALPIHTRFIARYLATAVASLNGSVVLHGVGPWSEAVTSAQAGLSRSGPTVSVSSYFTSIVHETLWLMRGATISDYGLALKIRFSLAHYLARVLLAPGEARCLSRADLIIVHYDSIVRRLVEEYGVSVEKIRKTPYTTASLIKKRPGQTKPVSVVPKPGNRPLCVTVCRQEPRKGVDHFLQAMKILVDAGLPVRGLVVGGGQVLAANKKLCARLGLRQLVEFTGFVPDVRPYLAAADIFVLASLQQGSSAIVVLEAMEAGLPIVVSDCDGLGEDIEDGVTGLVVPPGDPPALARAMGRLIDGRALARHLGTAAATEFARKYSPGRMGRAIADVYAELLGVEAAA